MTIMPMVQISPPSRLLSTYLLVLIEFRDGPMSGLRGPWAPLKKKNLKNIALYIYLTENFKIKRTNEIRKEIYKKIEKLESCDKEEVKLVGTMNQMCGY